MKTMRASGPYPPAGVAAHAATPRFRPDHPIWGQRRRGIVHRRETETQRKTKEGPSCFVGFAAFTQLARRGSRERRGAPFPRRAPIPVLPGVSAWKTGGKSLFPHAQRLSGEPSFSRVLSGQPRPFGPTAGQPRANRGNGAPRRSLPSLRANRWDAPTPAERDGTSLPRFYSASLRLCGENPISHARLPNRVE